MCKHPSFQSSENIQPAPLTSESYLQAIEELCHVDTYLSRVVKEFGRPPIWAREPGFPTIVHIILEQQVSLASARAAFNRLNTAIPFLSPQNFLTLDSETLKQIGFSRQKTGYSRELARSIIEGKLDLDAIAQKSDSDAKNALLSLKGIGSWSADIYLLMALLRPDVWPSGDLALGGAVQKLFLLEKRPTVEDLNKRSEAWRPWRAVAARILWHFYLSTKS